MVWKMDCRGQEWKEGNQLVYLRQVRDDVDPSLEW